MEGTGHSDAVTTTDRKENTEAAGAGETGSCRECPIQSENDFTINADDAFDILSLLSALHQPADPINHDAKHVRSAAALMDSNQAIAAEAVLLDVIDSLEQSQPQQTTTAPSEVNMDMARAEPTDEALKTSGSGECRTTASDSGPGTDAIVGAENRNQCNVECGEPQADLQNGAADRVCGNSPSASDDCGTTDASASGVDAVPDCVCVQISH